MRIKKKMGGPIMRIESMQPEEDEEEVEKAPVTRHYLRRKKADRTTSSPVHPNGKRPTDSPKSKKKKKSNS